MIKLNKKRSNIFIRQKAMKVPALPNNKLRHIQLFNVLKDSARFVNKLTFKIANFVGEDLEIQITIIYVTSKVVFVKFKRKLNHGVPGASSLSQTAMAAKYAQWALLGPHKKGAMIANNLIKTALIVKLMVA